MLAQPGFCPGTCLLSISPPSLCSSCSQASPSTPANCYRECSAALCPGDWKGCNTQLFRSSILKCEIFMLWVESYTVLWKWFNQEYRYLTCQEALVVKKPPTSARDVRDTGSIPGSGRSPRGGHGNPLQYSAWRISGTEEPRWATVHGVAQSRTRQKWLSTHRHLVTDFGESRTPSVYSRSCLFLSETMGTELKPGLWDQSQDVM